MKITELFSGITNVFKSDDLTDTLIDTRNRMRDGSVSVVQTCIAETSNVDFSKSKEYRFAADALKRHFGNGVDKGTVFQGFATVLATCDVVLDKMISHVDKVFTKTVDKDSLTYPRVQLMSLAENIDFISEYIPKYCRFIIISNGAAHGGESLEKAMTKAQLKYVRENLVSFFQCCTVIANAHAKGIDKILKEIPDVTVTDEGDENKMFAKQRLDPTGTLTRFLSASLNPFYYVRMAIVDWQHANYKRAKEEAESIKIELDAMNNLVESGQVDAFTERQRELANERLAKLDYEIAKYEEKARNTRY